MPEPASADDLSRVADLIRLNAPIERRAESRVDYSCVQLMAAYDGEGPLPDQSEFQPVRFRDISKFGFSFYVTSMPYQRNVVILLGKPPFRIFVGEVIHVGPSEDDPEPYFVGCRIVERVTSPKS